MNDFNTFGSAIQYEISPVILNKYTNFNPNSFLTNKCPSFSTEKKHQTDLGFYPSYISPYIRRDHDEINFSELNTKLEPKFITFSNLKTNINSMNSLKLNTQWFPQTKTISNFVSDQTSTPKSARKQKVKALKIAKSNWTIHSLKRSKIYLNQIVCSGHKLLDFPFCDYGTDYKISVSLINKLINKSKYFSVCKLRIFNGLPILDNDQLSKLNTVSLSTLITNNLNFYNGESDIFKIIERFYGDIISTLELIEKNYRNRRPKIFNDKLSLELQMLIRNCNDFTGFIRKKIKQIKNTLNKVHILKTPEKDNSSRRGIQYDNYSNKNRSNTTKNINGNIIGTSQSKSRNDPRDNPIKNRFISIFTGNKGKSNKLVHGKFLCDYCSKGFKNGQALGGHISQSHPRKSEKYQKKIEIRNQRQDKREIILQSRTMLLEQHGYDYNTWIANGQKYVIKRMWKAYMLEYKQILARKKKEYNDRIDYQDENCEKWIE